MSSYILLSVFIAVFAACVSLALGQCASCSGPKSSWKDSYSIDGKCYCDTTFDHDIGVYMVTDTSTGEEITVREACTRVGSGPSGDRVYYNDVQCGNGPINDAGDEEWCPGRVDLGTNNQSGCRTTGPKWSFPGGQQQEEPTTPAPTTPATPPPTTFVEESDSVLIELMVTDVSDGSSSPLGQSVQVSAYPSGFSMRAIVSDKNLIDNVLFESSDGHSKTERVEKYDMFGSKGGSWPNADALVGRSVVLTVVASKKDGTSETMEETIDFV